MPTLKHGPICKWKTTPKGTACRQDENLQDGRFWWIAGDWNYYAIFRAQAFHQTFPQFPPTKVSSEESLGIMQKHVPFVHKLSSNFLLWLLNYLWCHVYSQIYCLAGPADMQAKMDSLSKDRPSKISRMQQEFCGCHHFFIIIESSPRRRQHQSQNIHMASTNVWGHRL